MSNAFFHVPEAVNEPVKNYAPNSPERAALRKELEIANGEIRELPMWIDGKPIKSDNKVAVNPPDNHQKTIGYLYKGTTAHVSTAINAALKAHTDWSRVPWEERAAVFLRAADLLAGPFRYRMNAATMIGQSKNPYQAEIDSACELIDFFRFNVQYMAEIYGNQPKSAPSIWDRMEYRALEGFVFALTPFNFTSIAGNLPSAPALMGNTVVWKASEKQVYSAEVIMEILRAAGLPDGVINLVHASGAETAATCLSSPHFAGVHFTGSTAVFNSLWQKIANNIGHYKSYPRIVGETGGKDFLIAHESAEVPIVQTALSRGAFEYQGQKCSAVSRAYIPSNIWPELKKGLQQDISEMKMGPVEDFSNFINAVIDEKSFDKLAHFIDEAKENPETEIIAGGNYDKSKGYFIEPTIIKTTNPRYVTMCEELFGAVLTLFVYEPKDWKETLELVNTTSPYALTGAVIAQDRAAILEASERLRNAAGNFYINDKPTGAVVGQQPFGGARASGTNDKAGSYLNLIRWTSPRTIKETFVPPTYFGYPFMEG